MLSTSLRMDSTPISSDIRESSRLYLLAEGLKRLYRILDEDKKATYASLCEPCIQSEAKRYVYSITGRRAADEP